MKRKIIIYLIGFILVIGSQLSMVSFAEEGRQYSITITNVTRGQIITPPVVISHNEDFQLFEVGTPAIAPLFALAEDGVTDPLVSYIETLPSVLDYVVGPGPILPGSSITLEITTLGNYKYITAVGMLAVTNDAFFAIRSVRAPAHGKIELGANAYDAGSEVNSESCDYIPGPPCGSAGIRDPEGAEGYVHIHAGIHGIGDLDSSEHDWRNPVAEIVISAMDTNDMNGRRFINPFRSRE